MALSSVETDLLEIINSNTKTWKVALMANSLSLIKKEKPYAYSLFVNKNNDLFNIVLYIQDMEKKISKTGFNNQYKSSDVDKTMYDACSSLFNRYKTEFDSVQNTLSITNAIAALKSM